jgi:hypothetical protein
MGTQRNTLWQRAGGLVGAVLMMAGLVTGLQAQTYFKCRNAAGEIQYSDRACEGGLTAVEGVLPATVDSPPRKVESDARIQRDRALADRMESERRAREDAGRRAQDQQEQVNKSIANQIDQQRAKDNQPSPPRKVTDIVPITTLP